METCALNSNIPQDAVISMAQQESVIVLLKHCQEMRRLERVSRFFTVFLLLGCAAVFFFTQHVTRDNNQKDTPAEYTRQQGKDRQEQNLKKPNAHLTTSKSCNNSVPADYIQWEHQVYGLVHMQDFTYDEKKYSLVVPRRGQYFVYVGINFRMPDKDKISREVQILSLKVLKYSKNYNEYQPIMEVRDSLPDDGRREKRTLYTGQVVNLEEGDLLSVSVNKDQYELIDCSSETTMYIGAFLL